MLKNLIAQTGKSGRQLLLDFQTLQLGVWPMAAANYEGLRKIEEKSFVFSGFRVKVQFNPERIRSSAAKVDQKSIAERACFLCGKNRPAEQKVVEWEGRYHILLNPFPIFRHHFTIAAIEHIDQRFYGGMVDMLMIAADMEGFTLFYNGPECGASAPDHLHFQAGENSFMPVESEFKKLKTNDNNLLLSTEKSKIWAFDHYLRNMVSIETSDMIEGIKALEFIFDKLGTFQPEKEEPMLNVLCYFREGRWIIHLFPRKLHRPSHFFAEGGAQILLSPASVDFGGVFITPRKEDFDKITAADIADIFGQVTLDKVNFEQLKESISNELKF